ncbi:hypothetical protein [Limnovirga soli]|uniref:Uncharacterized protein n=1 Tax=Limnovirga soli TaxID=2656915 RepID=A0A8J8JU15_9BACT|nr:hypothetical protein [Limnovirga soli]NNV55069.1 hypothetical protein [Limnovirga soli]
MKKILIILLLFSTANLFAQQPSPPKISLGGSMGVSYEGYGLDLNPAGSYYAPRRPWNLVRFNFAPTFNFGKWGLPVNINFTPQQTNFVTPSTLGGYGSIGGKPQNLWQFLTNPLNNFGVSPKYKWAELQLGTQYLNYSELSTGDIGLFGYGFALTPKKFRVRFFNGVSQRPISYNALATPPIIGAYQRNNWMAQLGMEEEGKYSVSLNFAKGKDKLSSVNPAPPALSGILPQEGFTASFVVKTTIAKNYYFNSEFAHSIYTLDETQPLTVIGVKDLQPFIKANTSTLADNAAKISIGRKSKNFDIGISTKYLGAGFQTAGYPFMQPDRWDYTLNTRLNAWKNKMNITASIGQRMNNLSNTTLKSKQLIANVNWFTQFSDHFSVNAFYSNFGFQTSGINGLRNVANDLSINPTYTWTTEKIMHNITGTYSWSKYDERTNYNPLVTTHNNTHTALITYIPTYLNKKVSTDFTAMYFLNKTPLLPNQFLKTTFYSLSSNIGLPIARDKLKLKGQLMYTYNKTDGTLPKSDGGNILATAGADWNITKKLKWNISMTGSLFKYTKDFLPPSARYLESTVRTSFNYRFK